MAGRARPRVGAHEPGRLPMRRHRPPPRSPLRRGRARRNARAGHHPIGHAPRRRRRRDPHRPEGHRERPVAESLGATGRMDPETPEISGGWSVGRSSSRSARISRHSPMARSTSTAITAVPIAATSAPTSAPMAVGGIAVTRALQVDEAVADQSAAQPADQDRDECEDARARGRKGRERAGAVDGSGVVHDEHRRLPRRAPPRRAADLQRGRRTSPRCSDQGAGRGARRRGPRRRRRQPRRHRRPRRGSWAPSSEQIEVLRRPGKAGLGSAYRAGFRVGLERGLDVMVEMDSDLSHDPAALPSPLAPIDDGADLVIGSRYVPGGSIPNWRVHRRASVTVGQPVRGGGARASTCATRPRAIRAYRATMLNTIDLDEVRADGYGFQIEMAYVVSQAGGKIVEVPISFSDRAAGHVEDVRADRRRGDGARHLVGDTRPSAPTGPPRSSRVPEVGDRRAGRRAPSTSGSIGNTSFHVPAAAHTSS